MSRELETDQYPYLTPSDQLIKVINAVKVQGIHFKGTLVDAEFGNKQVVGHCVTHNESLLVRMKSNTRVEYCGEEMNLKSLLSHVPRTCCHSYPKLNWRAKRIAVRYDGHAVDILVIWRNIKGTWSAFFPLEHVPASNVIGRTDPSLESSLGDRSHP
ncbi:hypothetical protein Q0M94_25680 (plasmid) [Deinococcus radiomollis]|uniref:hypothetical protein n=1 Tax=Deinococcus radiomollis TaxID=468916 RepID=UPI003891241A